MQQHTICQTILGRSLQCFRLVCHHIQEPCPSLFLAASLRWQILELHTCSCTGRSKKTSNSRKSNRSFTDVISLQRNPPKGSSLDRARVPEIEGGHKKGREVTARKARTLQVRMLPLTLPPLRASNSLLDSLSVNVCPSVSLFSLPL